MHKEAEGHVALDAPSWITKFESLSLLRTKEARDAKIAKIEKVSFHEYLA